MINIIYKTKRACIEITGDNSGDCLEVFHEYLDREQEFNKPQQGSMCKPPLETYIEGISNTNNDKVRD